MTETKHSPLPWEDGTNHNGDPEWVFSSGAAVADCGFFSNDETNRENVRLIVRSVNLLPEALAALDVARKMIKGEPIESAVINTQTMQSLGSMIDAVLQKARQP